VLSLLTCHLDCGKTLKVKPAFALASAAAAFGIDRHLIR
jgi:hypothetical protein